MKINEIISQVRPSIEIPILIFRNSYFPSLTNWTLFSFTFVNRIFRKI